MVHRRGTRSLGPAVRSHRVVERPAIPLESLRTGRPRRAIAKGPAPFSDRPRPFPDEDHMRRRFNGLCRSRLKGTIRVLSVFAVLANWTASPAKSQIASSDILSGLPYRHIGPVGNRVSAVTGVPGDPNTYYFGAASGGSSVPRTGATTGPRCSMNRTLPRSARSPLHLRRQRDLGRHRRAIHP